MDYSNITQIIINTINTILGNLFSSVDNNLYFLLDDITFISSDILTDKNFENIFGASASNGILLICNSLLLGIIGELFNDEEFITTEKVKGISEKIIQKTGYR